MQRMVRAHNGRRRRPRASHPEDRDAGNKPRSDHGSGTAANPSLAPAPLCHPPRLQPKFHVARCDSARRHCTCAWTKTKNTRAHADALPEEPTQTATAGAEMQRRSDRAGSPPPRAAPPTHISRAPVTRVRASDATSRASSTTRPALIRPLPFTMATATQTRRHDCNQPGRASGSIKPTGSARPSAAREPAPPLVHRRTSLLVHKRCSEPPTLDDTNDRGEQEKRGRRIGSAKPTGPGSGVKTEAAGPSLAPEGGVQAVPGATVLTHDRRRFLVLQTWLCNSQPHIVRRPFTVAPTSRATASGQPLMPPPHSSPKRTLAPSSHGRIPRAVVARPSHDRPTRRCRTTIAWPLLMPPFGRLSRNPLVAPRVPEPPLASSR